MWAPMPDPYLPERRAGRVRVAEARGVASLDDQRRPALPLYHAGNTCAPHAARFCQAYVPSHAVVALLAAKRYVTQSCANLICD